MSQICNDLANFKEWLEAFLKEKDLSLEETTIEFEDHNGWNYMPIGVIAEFFYQQPPEIQHKVKDTVVKIDFMNGDIMHYLKFLGKGIGQTTKF